MDSPTSELVKVRDLPDSLFAAVSARLSHYTIAFIRLTPAPEGDEAQLLGSGVLVKAGAVHAILTAAHVIPLLPTIGELCLLLQPTSQPHVVDTLALTYRTIARGTVDSDGPDLATVVLAPTIASAIAAKKSFYNLDLQRDAVLRTPPDFRDGVWTVQGWVNERTAISKNLETREKTTRFYNFSGFGGPDPSTTADGYDYFDFVYERRAPDVAPQSWGGVSGGGLWQVALKREGDSIMDVKALLAGVAFFQDERLEGPFSIRCHGFRSTYEIAYEAIRGNTL